MLVIVKNIIINVIIAQKEVKKLSVIVINKLEDIRKVYLTAIVIDV